MSWKSARRETTERRDPMQELASEIIAELEQGVKRWEHPWDPAKCGGPQGPYNGATGHRYSGINVLELGMSKIAFETGDPRWCSYKQAQDHGWQVKAGAKGKPVFYTNTIEVEDEQEDDGKRKVRFFKYSTVFHFSQIESTQPYKPPSVEEAPWRSEEASEIIIRNSGAVVRIGGDRAFYSPLTDHIQIPPPVAFRSAAEEATTKMHELGHWTGDKKRLNRDLSGRYGSSAYAMEELRAELASAFVALELGIPTSVPNHASYLDGWVKVLKNDKREIFRATADAQKIVDMVLGFHPDFRGSPEPDRPGATSIRPTAAPV